GDRVIYGIRWLSHTAIFPRLRSESQSTAKIRYKLAVPTTRMRCRLANPAARPNRLVDQVLMAFDMHTHSYFSDGTISPADVIKDADRPSLAGVSLTHH